MGFDVARCPLISKEVGCRMPRSSKGAVREAGGKRGGRMASKEPRVQGERGSDARGTCPRVLCLLQKSIGGVGLREACILHFTRFGSCTGTGV